MASKMKRTSKMKKASKMTLKMGMTSKRNTTNYIIFVFTQLDFAMLRLLLSPWWYYIGGSPPRYNHHQQMGLEFPTHPSGLHNMCAFPMASSIYKILVKMLLFISEPWQMVRAGIFQLSGSRMCSYFFF